MFYKLVRLVVAGASLVGLVAVATSAYAMIEPVPIAADPRVKTIAYAPDVVFKYTGYLRYQTIVELSPGETVSTISLGDPTGWKINPSGNRIFIKPVDLDATTNMTLMTNKRTYLFEMHAEEVKNISDEKLTFILRFSYPDDTDGGIVSNAGVMDRVPDLNSDDLSRYNFRYTISGSEDISPIRIFDDGEFTFFEFRSINADIPAIFQVDKEGNENIINFRTRGHYIVVERVSGRYTLRHGNQVVCVFNEAWGGNAIKQTPDGGWMKAGKQPGEFDSNEPSTSRSGTKTGATLK